MADLIPPIVVSIEANTKNFESQIGRLDSRLNGLGGAAAAQISPLRGLTRTLGALGLAFGAYQVIQFGKSLIEAAEAETVSNARLQNITESMGLFGAEAGAVTTRLQDLAEQTSLNTGVDEDAIKATQAKLMTFKELGATADEAGGAFDRATQAAIDMAAAGFGEAEQNAIQLGKALNDPIKGITALGRAGITFTEQEKEKIKTLVESGDMLAAQAMVLGAIETQVGGTAEATSTGTSRMSAAFANLQETLGLLVLPAVENMANGLAVAFGFIAENLPTIGTFIGVLGGLAIALNAMAIANAIVNSQLIIMAVALLANPITWIVLGIAALAAGLVYLATKTTFFQDVWSAMSKFVGNAWNTTVKFFTNGFAAISKWFSELPANILKAIGDAAMWLFNLGKDIVGGLLKGIQSAWNGVVNWLQDAVSNAVDAVKDWLGIKSPSTVFAQIGMNMALGMKEGILATSGEVADAATSLASGATVSASIGVNGVDNNAAASYFAPSAQSAGVSNSSSSVSINAPVTVQTNANAQDISASIVNAIKFNLPYITAGAMA